MASERILKLRRLYRIVLCCAIVLSGILLMAACVGIYASGDAPFSRETVAQAFSAIALPLCLTAALLVAEPVLQHFFPLPAPKSAPAKQLSAQRRRLLQKADPDCAPDPLRACIEAEQALRTRHRRICALILTGCAVVFLAYALDGSHFHTADINGSMLRAMSRLLPCLTAAFCAALYGVRARGKSLQREIELLKQCPKRTAPAQPSPRASSGGKIRFALLLAAAALAVFGFCTGGTADVLTKAVNICTECIGLG